MNTPGDPPKVLKFHTTEERERANIVKVLEEALEEAREGKISSIALSTYYHLSEPPKTYMARERIVTTDNYVIVRGMCHRLLAYAQQLDENR